MSSGFRSILTWTLSAGLSALALASGFPSATPFDVSSSILVPLSFVPLFFVILGPTQDARSFLLRYISTTWSFGFLFSCLAFRWIMVPAISFGGLSSFWGGAALFVYATLAPAYFLVLFAPLIFLRPSRSRCRSTRIWLDAACGALLVGALETMIPRFFRWTIGMLLHRSDELSQLAALFGASTGSVPVVLTGLVGAIALWGHVENGRSLCRLAGRWLLPLTAAWAVLWLGGKARLFRNEVESERKLRVAYIQPNLTFSELASDAAQEPVEGLGFSNFLEMSREVIKRDGAVDLLVWPESVFPSVLGQEFEERFGRLGELQRLSTTSKVPILVQATQSYVPTTGGRTDSSVSFLIQDGDIREQVFKKWIPMPFGESIPLETVFPFLGDLVRSHVGNISKIERGVDPAAFDLRAGVRVAPLICFDAIEPRIARLQVSQSGATFFVNQANFAWMRRSNAALEFAIITKFRAIETGRSFLLAANSGPTLAWDTMGRALGNPTALMMRSTGVIDLPFETEATPYVSWGDLPLQILGALSCLWLVPRRQTA